MRIYKCDRCGNTYEKQAKIVRTDYFFNGWNGIDLCQECQCKLLDWLNLNVKIEEKNKYLEKDNKEEIPF